MNGAAPENSILVLGDDSESRIYLSTLLRGNGYKPVRTLDISDGFDLVRASRPVLIILDMTGPEKNGIRFFEQVKSRPDLQQIPVIMLSDIAPETYLHFQKIHGSAVGFRVPEPEALLEKPPEAEDLLHWVEELIGSQQPERGRW